MDCNLYITLFVASEVRENMTNSLEIEDNAHRTPAQYVAIGIVLCVLTSMEITLYYLEENFNRTILVAGLIGLAAIKFVLVAAYFMHLKDDPKIFKIWFTIGGISAVVLFTAVLASLSFQDHKFF